MNEELWSENQYNDDNLYVSIVETTDAITGKTIFIAMADDTSKLIGTGENCEEALINLENKMYEADEFDSSIWELTLAS